MSFVEVLSFSKMLNPNNAPCGLAIFIDLSKLPFIPGILIPLSGNDLILTFSLLVNLLPISIIFGSSGQDGYYLNKLLLRNNIKTINISRKSGDVIGDVSDFKFVENVIKKYTPNFIFHFAAVSSTKHEFLFENNFPILPNLQAPNKASIKE